MRTNLNRFVAAMMRGRLCIFAAAIALFPAIGRSQEYTVTDLGNLSGGHYPTGMSTPTAVNNAGQVAGYSDYEPFEDQPTTFPFIYSNGVMNQLGWSDIFYFAAPLAMNDDGVVVGEYSSATHNAPDSYPATLAFLWNGAEQTLAPPENQSYASAINGNGVAVGANGFLQAPFLNDIGFLQGGVPIGVIFNDGLAIDIPTGPYLAVSPTGINNAGQISGECITSNYLFLGCVVTVDTQQLLQPLPAFSGTSPSAINSSGYTCGISFTGPQSSPTATTATYWKNSAPINLGAPANTHNSACNGMDDYGNGVGDATSKTEGQIGVIYDPLNGARDLNKLIPKFSVKGHGFLITNAVSISDTGFIAAQCSYENGNNDACLLTLNTVLALHDNVLTLAETDHRCIPCEEELAPEARSLPKSLDGLTADERERVVSTVNLIGEQLERLERDGQILEAKAMLVIHDAQLVLAAIDPRR